MTGPKLRPGEDGCGWRCEAQRDPFSDPGGDPAPSGTAVRQAEGGPGVRHEDRGAGGRGMSAKSHLREQMAFQQTIKTWATS